MRRLAPLLLLAAGCTVGLDWTAPAASGDGGASPDGRALDVAPGICPGGCRGATPYCCGGVCRGACCADSQCTDGNRRQCCPSGACRECCDDGDCSGSRRCCNGTCESRCG